MAKKVGFVGLGNMGKPMAVNILRKGFDLTVWIHRNPKPAEELRREGAKITPTLRELAANTDVTVTCLSGASALEEVVFAPNGLAEGARPGWILVEASTIEPDASRKVAAQLAARGLRMLDAPVSGGIPVAREGRLSTMVGGDPAVLAECREVMEAYARNIFHIGPEIGSGLMAKMVNNLMSISNFITMLEALALGAKAGLDLSVIVEMVKASGGTSSMFERRAHRIIKHDFEAQGSVDITYKDIELINHIAQQMRVPVPMASTALQVFQMGRGGGLGAEDINALITVYEKLLGIEVRG